MNRVASRAHTAVMPPAQMASGRSGLRGSALVWRMAAADEEEDEPMTFQTTDPNGAHELMDEAGDSIFVDIRTVAEFEAGHAPGSFNIPFLFRQPTGFGIDRYN